MPAPGSVSDAAESVVASRCVIVKELGCESTESVVPRLSNCCIQLKAIAKRLLQTPRMRSQLCERSPALCKTLLRGAPTMCLTY